MEVQKAQMMNLPYKLKLKSNNNNHNNNKNNKICKKRERSFRAMWTPKY